ncbi:family 2 glycosyl transferase [Actinoplanes sp. SE50]|uniref:glycosyltransferase family 2 protein n=1 Tax=unclassified Actinoplanes TaxID=2626549 RepID=UPI00023EDDED|nr:MULTISPECIES: glycosyltransferase family 2 protein [unclassified Actinoplanes]AEV89238.1 glycosyl transferase family 2 [Actinoplanes sp. SE50/110]ATO87644.1 family 2 glycosyl transferase [Actinoplanes sp. SE50]SLM05063.1 family 2 glycosyl transferase [Actinoplanes sp. SE50/110]
MAEETVSTAARLLSTGQKALAGAALAVLTAGLVVAPRVTAAVTVGACVLFYLLFALFKVLVTTAGRGHRMLLTEVLSSSTRQLPHYGVLLPVHREANMLRRLVARVSQLDYPRDRLHVYLLIEHDDEKTLAAAAAIGLRVHGDGTAAEGPLGHVVVVVVPPGGPKTKPNAMNVAFPILVADGCRYVTIYDAEDRPDPEQLRLAVATFRLARRDVVCLQAELVFWNDDTNWVSALYWVGYKVHFRHFLPGLARLGLPVPLGGTSNHFKVNALLEVALPGGLIWDPHNLTEDADLGARLATAGYRVDLMASVTLEEAPVSSRVVDKQQRRWKGGYLQTALVHSRRPWRAAARMGVHRWLAFLLMTYGTPLTFLLNPLFLALAGVWFASGSEVIVDLFPAPVYYTATGLLVVGNFGIMLELVQTTLAEASRTRGRFGLLKYMFMAQVMWLWMSFSTYVAVFEMVTGKRGWHKTPHGHAETDDDLVLVLQGAS